MKKPKFTMHDSRTRLALLGLLMMGMFLLVVGK